MAKFIFGLQNVLDVKEKIESQAKQDFANAVAILEDQKQKLAELFRRKEELLAHGQELIKGVLDFREIENNRLSVKYVEGKIEEQTVNVNKAEANVERARRKMADAMADRKTYEKLREKAFEEFVAEENRAEGKAVDELTSYKYSIKSDK